MPHLIQRIRNTSHAFRFAPLALVLLLVGMPLGRVITPSPVRAATPLDFRPLFNGTDFDGWTIDGPPGGLAHADGRPVWSIRDGEIICDGNSWSFLRYERRTFRDFTLRVEFVMGPDGNSGIGVRCREVDLTRVHETRPSCWAYEIQLLDDATQPPTMFSSGSLYRYVAPRHSAMRPAGEWNTLEVTCIGPRIRVSLNGREIQDFDQTTLPETATKPLEGFVCLQNHGHPVRFRNVLVREEIPSASAE
jgi:hypothetical protein